MTAPIKSNVHSSSPRYLKVGEVAARFNISVPTVWRYVKSKKDFPQPVRLSAGCTRWSEASLQEFEARLTAA